MNNMPDTGEKLQKILAARGLGSRRDMEQLIQQGRVTVNRRPAVIGLRVSADDILAVDGQLLKKQAAAFRLLSYHKPAGKITERGAAQSVFDDLPPVTGGRWINIGRLDVNSEGLLLFCTDGEWVEKLAHPRNEVEREYLARADGALTAAQIQKINAGVPINGKPLQPRYFAPHSATDKGRNHWYRLILTEGRNRAVRRLFAYFGLQVGRLIRLRMGAYRLPRDLPAGAWREVAAVLDE